MCHLDYVFFAAAIHPYFIKRSNKVYKAIWTM